MSAGDGRPFDLTPLSEVERRAVPWLWPGWVPANGVTLLPGDPKLGKSTLALDLAARLSRGEIGDPDRAPTSIIVTGEDSVPEVVEPRVAAAGGALCHVHALDVSSPEAEFTLPDHIPDLEHRIFDVGAQLVVIDPLNRFLADDVDGHKDKSIRRAMGPLHQVAERQRCAILLNAHLNKGVGGNALYRVGGSIGLTGAARSVMLFAKDPDDPEGELGSQRILAQAGSNYGRQQPSRRYRIEPVLLPATDNLPEVQTIRLIDQGEVEIAASDLLTAPTGEERTERDEAVEFLRAELAGGPLPVREIRKAARGAGISDRTLDRAKAALGLATRRVGGAAARGHWEWALSTPPPLTPPGGALSETRMDSGNPGPSGPKDATVGGVASLAPPATPEEEAEAARLLGLDLDDDGELWR